MELKNELFNPRAIVRTGNVDVSTLAPNVELGLRYGAMFPYLSF